MDTFQAILRKYKDERGYSIGTIDEMIAARFSQCNGFEVPSATLGRWFEKEPKKPVSKVRSWSHLLAIALVLDMTYEDANKLLNAAGHPSLTKLGVGGTKIDETEKCVREEILAHFRSKQPSAAESSIRGEEDVDRIVQSVDVVREAVDTTHSEPPTRLLPEVSDLPRGSRLNYHSNSLFVGRDDLLLTIFEGLDKKRGVVLTGSGGIGKTQLAIEFAYRFGSRFEGGVFLLSCADRSMIDLEIAACGGSQGMQLRPNFDKLDLDEQLAHVRSAFVEPTPRLLILDNVESSRDVERWLMKTTIPNTGGCKVIITSRRERWAPAFPLQVLPVVELARDFSCQLLMNMALRLERLEASDIAEELGDYPLALHLAGCYLSTYRTMKASDFLDQLRNLALDHAALRGKGADFSPTDYEPNVARCFSLSYDNLDPSDALDTLALQLLTHAAYLAPSEAIPVDLLQVYLDNWRSTELVVEDGVLRLLDLGLVRTVADNLVYVHPLIGKFVRVRSKTPPEDMYDALLPSLADSDTQPILRRSWIPHVQHLVNTLKQEGGMAAAKWCVKAGYWLDNQRMYDPARSALHWALEEYERLQMEDPQGYAKALSRAGYHYSMIYDLDKAREYWEQALALLDLNAESGAANTRARILSNLGFVAIRKAQLADARRYLEESLKIREEIQASSRAIAMTYSNLGQLCFFEGNLEGSLEYLNQALAIRLRELKRPHNLIASTLFRLGMTLHALGDSVEAEKCLQVAVEELKGYFGDDHPEAARQVLVLGMTLYHNQKYPMAVMFFLRARELYNQILGEEHHETAEAKEWVTRASKKAGVSAPS